MLTVGGLLAVGDVIELLPGHDVYADIPLHFAYTNYRGNWELTHHEVRLRGNFEYLCGKYIVARTAMDGGGRSGIDEYPDGHHVYCEKEDDRLVKVDFYQTGSFTAMIRDIKAVAHIY